MIDPHPGAVVGDVAPQWFLSALDAEPECHVVSLRGVEVAARRWGRPGGAPVVLVHGGAAHARWWDHLAPALSGDRQVLALDLSGHGDSGWRKSYSLANWADEVALVLRLVSGSAPPVVVGHSMGGLVSLELAQRQGARLAHAVVVDSFLAGQSKSPAAAREVPRLARSASRASLVERFRLSPAAPALPFLKSYVAEHSVREQAGLWEWKFDPRLLTTSVVDQVVDAPVPCGLTVVRGELGDMPGESVDRIRAMRRADLRVATVDGGGHHLMLDRPQELLTEIRCVLAEV